MEKAFYRVNEVAEIIGLGRSMTYKLVHEGTIPSVRFLGMNSIRVPRKALEDWIAAQIAQEYDGGESK